MLKKLLLITVLQMTAFALFALDVNLIPSLGVNLFDQVTKVPSAFGLTVSSVRQVVRQQPFHVYFSLGKRDAADRDLKYNGVLVLIKPDGKREKITETVFFDIPKGRKGVFISPVDMVMIFEKNDTAGIYFFELTISDSENPVKKETFSASVELLDRREKSSAKLTQKEFSKFFSKYYQNPQPDNLLPALRFFLDEGIDLMRKKKGSKFDPRHILHGFAVAFKLNPQLWRELAEMTVGSPDKDHLYYALIFAGIGKEAVMQNKEIIEPLVQVQIGQFAGKNPLDFQECSHPVHLDMLWMEFFVTGKFSPIENIARELRKRDILSLNDAKKIRESKRAFTDEEKLRLRNFMLGLSAHWSLRANIRQGNQLVAWYLTGMVQRKECADASAEALIINILKNINKKNNNKKANPPSEPVEKE